MSEFSLRALAGAGVQVPCPVPHCCDALYPRNLRRHLEGKKHRLADAALSECLKRARTVLPLGSAGDTDTVGATRMDEDGDGGEPQQLLNADILSLSPQQLRLMFSSFCGSNGYDVVSIAALALRLHLEQPNIDRDAAADAVRAAVALCDDLTLSACRCFVTRVDELDAASGAAEGTCPADGSSWLPWANGTECVLFLLMQSLALSEDQQATLLHALRLPCFDLAHVPASPAFYQRVARQLRPTVGRVVVETPPDAANTVDVVLPSELVRVALNAPRMFATLRFKPFAYALHDPADDHFSSTRLARRHPLLRIAAADTPAGRVNLGDVVRVKGRMVRAIEFYLAPPPRWVATAIQRLCPEAEMVLALGGEALLTRADAGTAGALAPAGPQWAATYGIRRVERVNERHYVSDVASIHRRVPSFNLQDDWRGGDGGAIRIFFELSDARPRAVRFLDATHRAYQALDTAAGVRIYDGEDSPVLWAGTQPPAVLPWDFTSYAAADGGHRWTGDVDALPRLVFSLVADSDAANVSHGKTGRESSMLRASTALLSANRSARHRAPGFSPLAVIHKGTDIDALECVKNDYERLAQGVVIFSSALNSFVHITGVLCLRQMDSADRFGQQVLPSHQALEGPCGGCDVSHVSGDDRGAFLKPLSLASLRTDAKALASVGTPGWPASPAPYTSRLPSFDNFQQLIVGPLHFAILGVLRKSLVLLMKRTVGQNGTTLSEYLKAPLAALEAALDDEDKHCSWTQRVLSIRAMVKFLNGGLTARLLEVFLFAVNEVVALGKADSKQQRVNAMSGLVDFVFGVRYMMQAPSTPRAKREAKRLMIAGVTALALAFPPGTHKGTGAKGLNTVLAHLTHHVEFMLALFGTGSNADDSVVEERHQEMKAVAGNVNRGRRDTWPRTIHESMRLVHSLRLAFHEKRYGGGLQHRLGADAAAFSVLPHVAVGKLVWGSQSFSDAVEVMLRSIDDLSPRPSFISPVVAACAALSCWCCPAYTASPPLVVWRRGTSASHIVLTFGVGGVPTEPTHASAAQALLADRLELTRDSFVAAFPGAAASVCSLRQFGALKLPGISTAVRVGDWVLVDRAKVLSAWRLLKPDSHDAVVQAAAARYDPQVAVADDYQFWPERYVVARVRDIFAVEVGGVFYTLFTPVYYEFADAPSGTDPGENILAFARDTPRGAARPVGTNSWIVERWMGGTGAQLDEQPLPTSVIHRVPNVVHACTAGGCKSAAACVHGMYVGLPEPVRSMMSQGCRCSAKLKSARRIVHNCMSNDRWLVSPFDLSNKSVVKW